MTPLYFGDGSLPLYGMYMPAVAPSRREAVVLCPPFGEEAIRAARTFRVLGQQLAVLGFSVLRFDFPGMGESGGGPTAIDLDAWVEAVADAHDEISHMAAVRRVTWVGLRLGATMALLAGRDAPAGLHRIVAWDPVLDGADYVERLKAASITHISSMLGDDHGSGGEEAFGFPFPATFQEQLRGLNADSLLGDCQSQVSVLGGTPPEQEGISHAEDPFQDQWDSDAALNAFTVPKASLDRLVSLVADEEASR